MTIKEQIAKMIEQCSIDKDNPTVLRALLKLQKTVCLLIDEVDKLQKIVEDADIDQIKDLINGMQSQVDDAVKQAQEALKAAQDADAKADGLVTEIETIKTELTTLSNDITNIQTAVNEASEKSQQALDGLDNKQDKLTFDSTPTEGSNNPVTSDGIYKAIQEGGGSVTLDDTVTADSQNGVKSSGIYTAIKNAQDTVQGNVDALDTRVTAQGVTVSNLSSKVEANEDAITALQDFQTTQETTNETHNTQIAANKSAVDKVTSDLATFEESTNTALDGKQKTLHPYATGTGGVLRTTILQYPRGLYWHVPDEVVGHDDELASAQAVHSMLNQFYHKEVENKQDSLTFDTTPTEGSSNPVTSDGIYKAIQAGGTASGQEKLVTIQNEDVNPKLINVEEMLADIPAFNRLVDAKTIKMFMDLEFADNAFHVEGQGTATSVDKWVLNSIPADPPSIYKLCNALAVYNALKTKQNELKNGDNNILTDVISDLSTEPDANKLATALAVYNALKNVSIILDDAVTESSANGVKSSGIYNAIKSASDTLSVRIGTVETTANSNSAEIHTLQTGAASMQSELDTHAGDIASLQADKMDKMTVDTNPIENSPNLVTSGGVFNALKNAGSSVDLHYSAPVSVSNDGFIPENIIPLHLNVEYTTNPNRGNITLNLDVKSSSTTVAGSEYTSFIFNQSSESYIGFSYVNSVLYDETDHTLNIPKNIQVRKVIGMNDDGSLTFENVACNYLRAEVIGLEIGA